MSAPSRSCAVLTIDLDAVATNYAHLSSAAGGAEVCAVVKADAYGLGMARVAPVLARAGCKRFFVALIDEGIALRTLLADAEIHVLNGLLPGTEADFDEHRLIPVLNSREQVHDWARHCERLGQRLPADLHIDSGMNRLGMGAAETQALINDQDDLGRMHVEFMVSHLACAEERESAMNSEQLDRFNTARARLPAAAACFANSSGIFLGPAYCFDAVRPGCAIYGVNPTPDTPNQMSQVVHLQGKIVQTHDVDSPMSVGYGATHRIEKKRKIATVAVGYADGYLRSLSNRGTAYVGDVRAPILGRVSMDLITIDVSDAPERLIRPGHFVDLIGPHNPVDVVAENAGTIGYEILTGLGARYHRDYVGGDA
ncbi:MAG: alanine racemase [Rhodospirillales bacterium]|nr:alanine racemase [Rhodospirillales bacterium]